jgi:hypothetical protein
MPRSEKGKKVVRNSGISAATSNAAVPIRSTRSSANAARRVVCVRGSAEERTVRIRRALEFIGKYGYQRSARNGQGPSG